MRPLQLPGSMTRPDGAIANFSTDAMREERVSNRLLLGIDRSSLLV